MYRIAIVDDNETWCFVLGSRLQQQGYEVSTFTDANLFLPQAERFDLAIIDFSMPPRRYQFHLDGPALINKLKQQLDNPPWLILISAFFTEDVLSQDLDLCFKADVCLSKSVDSAELIQQIERLLTTTRPAVREHQATRHSSQTLQTSASSNRR